MKDWLQMKKFLQLYHFYPNKLKLTSISAACECRFPYFTPKLPNLLLTPVLRLLGTVAAVAAEVAKELILEKVRNKRLNYQM